MSLTILIPALMMGFLGSPHCMGMCGGIVTAFGISMKNLSVGKKNLLIATYHTGRLLSYMALGLIATLFGQTILAPLLTNNTLPRILLGLAIVFAALLMLGLPYLNRLERLGLGLWNRLAPIRQKVLPMDSVPKALVAGLLWGLLPCGLVYGALGVAVSLGATQQLNANGVLFMLAFGIGTLPMLVLTGTALSWLQQKVSALNLRRFSGAIMLVSGLLIMVSPTTMSLMHSGHDAHQATESSTAPIDHSQHNMSDTHAHHH